MMDDSISRQAAVDIVRHECGEWKGLAKEIVKQFNELPSEQPEERTKERTETHTDYIKTIKLTPVIQSRLTCDGCRYNGYYKPMRCRNCLRKESDLYEPE